MSDPHDPKSKKFSELVSAYLHGQLSPEEAARLEALLRDSPRHRDRFVREAYIYHQAGELMRGDARADLMEDVAAAGVVELTEDDLVDADTPDGSSAMAFVIDQALAERRKHDLEDEANRRLEAQQAEESRNRRYELRRHAAQEQARGVIVIPKAVVWLGLAAAVGLIATVVTVLTPPSTSDTDAPPAGARADTSAPVLATVVRTLDARWEADADAWQGVLGLREGRHRLAEGTVEIELIEGTRVVLEAPVSFTLTGPNAMELSDGRLVAHVPPSGYGFTVDTPTARIVDCGTEFGVVADSHRGTQVHVFEGEVRAAARVEGVVIGEALSLLEQQAISISADPTDVERIAFDDSEFKRRVVRRLDLVDIVAGGNGTGEATGGINPTNGEAQLPLLREGDDFERAGSGDYIPVPGLDCIDGVFIAGYSDRVVTDSSGGVVTIQNVTPLQLQDSGEYTAFGNIWAGQVIPSAEGQPDARNRRLILLHSPMGITFDLHAVTNAHAGAVPLRFRTVVFNEEARHVDKPGYAERPTVSADFLVIVDGEVRQHLAGLTSMDGEQVLEVELQEGDRFLTLFTADGGDGRFFDGLVLYEPVVELDAPISSLSYD